MISRKLLATAIVAGFILPQAASAQGPEVVSGPGADPACFAPTSDDTKYFKWPAREGPYKIALVNGFIANDWRVQMIAVAKAYAEQPEVAKDIEEFKVISVGEDIAAQIAAANNFIDQGFDAIIINANNTAAFSSVVRKANEANVVVLSFDNVIDDPNQIAINVDQTGLGRAAAEFLLSKTDANPAKFLHVRGPAGQPVDIARNTGFHEVIDASGREVEVTDVVGNWAPGDAQKVTADAIAAGGVFDGIYVQGGSQGTATAMLDAGKFTAPISGETENAFRMICNEKSLECQSGGTGPAQSSVTIKTAIAALKGEVVPQSIALPTSISELSQDGVGRELNLVDPEYGSDMFFEVISLPVVSALDPRGSVISVLRDITDLRRALSELEDQIERARLAEIQARRESERLNVIIENAGEPILVTDPDSNIILMNLEAERLFEIAPEAAGSPWEAIIRTNDTKFTGLMSDFLMQPVQRRVERLELIDPDGARRVPVEVVSTKILNRRGEPTAVVSVLHDLTQTEENERLARELRQFNEELEERIVAATRTLAERNQQLEWQSEQLERASRLKSEFLASMSHEFRTPINAIIGYASLLRERIYGELTPDQELALEKTQAASRHLLDLVNDILDLSKIEAGEVDVTVDSFRLERLLEEVSRTIEPLRRKKPLAYHLETTSDLPTLRTDRTKLQQVLLNLISNAVKFTQEGSIRIRARIATEKPDRIVIDVEDTGIGIKTEHLEAIFEDFRQVDQSSTREYGGTGLGLSISRKLLALLGGTISVQSVYGHGSTFTIELPVTLEPRRATRESAPPFPVR